MSTKAPGQTVVNASSFLKAAILSGSYAISIRVKSGFLPLESLILNMSIETLLSALLGSLRSLRVISPVLVIVVVNIRSSTLSIVFGPETFKERLGPIEVTAEERTRGDGHADDITEGQILCLSIKC